jgi:hypothetical protein
MEDIMKKVFSNLQNLISPMLLTLALILVVLLSFKAQAIRPSVNEDFGSLIEENMAAQKQLTQDLQKQLKTKDLNKAVRPNFKEVGEQVLGKNRSENVAVETSDTVHKKSTVSVDIEKKNFNRLSEEMKEIK